MRESEKIPEPPGMANYVVSRRWKPGKREGFEVVSGSLATREGGRMRVGLTAEHKSKNFLRMSQPREIEQRKARRWWCESKFSRSSGSTAMSATETL